MLLTVYFCLYSSYKNKVFIFKCVIYSVLYRVQLNNTVLESNLFLSSQLWSKICLTSRFLLMTKKQNRFWVSALVLRENVHLSAEFLNTKVGEFFPLLSGRMSSSLSECMYIVQETKQSFFLFIILRDQFVLNLYAGGGGGFDGKFIYLQPLGTSP